MRTIFFSIVSILITFSTLAGTDPSVELDYQQRIKSAYEKADKIVDTDPKRAIAYVRDLEAILPSLSLSSNVTYYSKISGYYMMDDNIQEMHNTANKGLAIAPNGYESTAVADLYNYKGVYQLYYHPDDSIATFKKALNISKKLGHTTGILDSYLHLASIYTEKFQFVLAHNYSEKAYSLALEVDNKQYLAHSSTLIGDIYTYMQRDEEALKYRTEALNAYEELKNDVYANFTRVSVAGSLSALKRFHLAEKLLLNVINNPDTFPIDLFDANLLMAEILDEKGDYQKAFEYINQARKYIEHVETQSLVARWYVFKLSILTGLNRLDEAKKLLATIDKGELFKSTLVSEIVKIRLSNKRSSYWEKVGDHEKALKYFKQYNQQWIDFKKINSSNMLNELKIKFEMDKMEQENKDLIHKNEISAIQLAQSEQDKAEQRNFIIVIIVLFLIITPMIWHQIALKRKLHRMVNRDSLTRVRNRNYLMFKGAKLFEKTRRRFVHGVIVLDVDNFKTINDRYGHHVGDKVLRALAQSAELAIRHTDRFGRMGGEEFVALLPNTTLDAAKEIAERVRVAIQNYEWDSLGLSDAITVSVGVTAISNQEEDGFLKSLKIADKAMYKAKKSGKNKVVSL